MWHPSPFAGLHHVIVHTTPAFQIDCSLETSAQTFGNNNQRFHIKLEPSLRRCQSFRNTQ